MGPWLWHAYTIGKEEKRRQMDEVIQFWKLEKYVDYLREVYGAVDPKASEATLERRLTVERSPEVEDEIGAAR
jgi:hypothetical protein